MPAPSDLAGTPPLVIQMAKSLFATTGVVERRWQIVVAVRSHSAAVASFTEPLRKTFALQRTPLPSPAAMK